jgi:predicted Zn finger-like uncharacterized protein
MAIPFRCPGCRTAYNLTDGQRGQRLRCKRCQETFVVPDAGGEGRIRPRPRRAPRGMPLGLLVGLGVGGLVLLVGLGAGLWGWLSTGREGLPRGEVDAADRTGRDPDVTPLPEARPADWSAVRTVPLARAAVGVGEQPDPAPAPKGDLLPRPLKLEGPGDVQRILFSVPDTARALVLTAVAEEGGRNRVRADRYDLANGQHLGGSDLFRVTLDGGGQLTLTADFSPDGTRLVVRAPREQHRVDVWSADGQHVAGWVPYGKEPAGQVRWVGFFDSGKVLTLSVGGKLALWAVPGCRAVWATDFVSGTVALSPGRKFLAACVAGTYGIFDTASGELRGRLEGVPVGSVLSAAFRPDGRELAAVVRAGESLARWDLKSGHGTPGSRARTDADGLAWCGTGYLLHDDTLYDAEWKWPVTRYVLPGQGRLATGTPDGRLWFATGRKPGGPAELAALPVPDDPARELALQAAEGKVKVLLPPGAKVSVQVDVQDPRRAATSRQRAVGNLTGVLRSMGLEVVAAGDLRLAVRLGPEQDTGKKILLEDLPGRKSVAVPVKEVACRAVLTDSRGTTLWEVEQPFRTPDAAGVPPTGDPAAALDDALWGNCANWCAGLQPGSVLVRTAAGVEVLPRMVLLGGDR